MKKLWPLIAILLVGWYGFARYQNHSPVRTEVMVDATPAANILSDRKEVSNADFSCDGRSHCSQMHSCEEATLFLKHCPGMEMDGDGDGVPCERQWCGSL